MKRNKSFSKFKKVRPKEVDLAEVELVRRRQLDPGSLMPLVLEPTTPDVDPVDWASDRRAELEADLLRHGAILFRGFAIDSIPAFEAFSNAICPALYGDYGDLPRESEAEKVYGATPYPPDKAILFHNESSHMDRWPMKQFFYSIEVAPEGGETPLVDGREAYRRIDPKLAARFREQGLLYVRNFIEGLDVAWQEFFHTDDRAEVERRCREAGMECRWLSDRHLRVAQRAPAVLEHPKTGETVFFNQVQLHHVSCLDPELRRSVESLFDPESYPRNVYFGDGTPIEDAVIEEICELYWDLAVSFPWQRHDVVAVDNMLVSHARKPYRGPRRIAVAMGELWGAPQTAGSEVAR